MYIQITTRCNMSCAHCCNNCTEHGEDMSIEVFKAAIGEDDYNTIGGGEPTLHGQFWEMIGLALGHSENVWLATNGSITETALTLANMARRGILGCALSQDDYHDEIDDVVIQAFTKEERSTGVSGTYQTTDQREIRNVSGKEINTGRCDFGQQDCVCSDLVVKPNGDVYTCGCDDAPCLGNVLTSFEYPNSPGECWKDQETEEGE